MKNLASIFGTIGALYGFLGVAFGAFGAHALRGRIAERDLEIFEIAVRYQLTHALALLLLTALSARLSSGTAAIAGWSFVGGTLVFSGSLFALVFTGIRGLGAITPLGGVALLAGWLALAWGLFRS